MTQLLGTAQNVIVKHDYLPRGFDTYTPRLRQGTSPVWHRQYSGPLNEICRRTTDSATSAAGQGLQVLVPDIENNLNLFSISWRDPPSLNHHIRSDAAYHLTGRIARIGRGVVLT